MPRSWLPVLFVLTALFPIKGNAQVFQFRSPSPEVTAASALWQLNGDPVVLQGLVYYPTREFRMFDGQVMTQIGLFNGVPIYADVTREPFRVVYVPVGRDRMRAFERPRSRDVAGTMGTASSRAEVPTTTGAALAPNIPDRTPTNRRYVESIARPTGSHGVWLEFNGSRWYSAGAAVPFSPGRFRPIGEHRGFPVYREMGGDSRHIWVTVVKDGPVAPYAKR
jgi:hypothetical protein